MSSGAIVAGGRPASAPLPHVEPGAHDAWAVFPDARTWPASSVLPRVTPGSTETVSFQESQYEHVADLHFHFLGRGADTATGRGAWKSCRAPLACPGPYLRPASSTASGVGPSSTSPYGECIGHTRSCWMRTEAYPRSQSSWAISRSSLSPRRSNEPSAFLPARCAAAGDQPPEPERRTSPRMTTSDPEAASACASAPWTAPRVERPNDVD